MSKKGREYKSIVKDKIAERIMKDRISGRTKAVPRLCAGSTPSTNRLKMWVCLHAPNRRKYDIDNRAKALLDAMQDGGLFENDEQVDHLWLNRGEIIKGGLASVYIYDLQSDLE
jgi:Holliday junction resolvase RusA-like endonuclease